MATRRQGEFYHTKLARKFYWEEVDEFISMWGDGLHIADIANRLGCEPEEVFVLALDLTLQGEIGSRKNGVFGNAQSVCV